MRDTHLACDLGGDHALLEQVGGSHTPLLQRRKIASRPRLARLLLYRNSGHA
jgi:hypothetical protein